MKKKSASKPEVVITGIGIVSPIGEGVEEWWKNLSQNKSGIDKIKQFDASSFPCSSAAEVKNWEPSKYMSKRYERTLSRGSQFALAAFDMAKVDANIKDFEPYNTDIIVGAAQIGFENIENEVMNTKNYAQTYAEKQDPTLILKTMISLPSNLISIRAKTKGHVSTHSSACISGLAAVNEACYHIINGLADTAITGGVDTFVSRMILQAFCQANAVAIDNGEEASQVVKPFDANRTRSVLGEGSCIFILENKERALARNARIYASIVPGKQYTENTNVAFTHEKSGETWGNALKETVKEKGIDHINAHAPGDKVIDRIEASAFRKAFGKQLEKIKITSIKSTTGGGSAFASAAQVATVAKAIYEGEIPPTVNYNVADPELEGIEPIFKKPKKQNIKKAIVSAHGMGGVNASILLEANR